MGFLTSKLNKSPLYIYSVLQLIDFRLKLLLAVAGCEFINQPSMVDPPRRCQCRNQRQPEQVADSEVEAHVGDNRCFIQIRATIVISRSSLQTFQLAAQG